MMMPLYEYRCESCSRLFESYRRAAEESETESCPSCGGKARREAISLVNAPGGGGPAPGGRSCGGGGRRSPFS